MGWRSLVINQPAKLRREHFSLAVEQTQTVHVPFEDIAVVVLHHAEITLTHPVLSACAEYGIGLYCTGSNHQPSGILLPFQAHSRATRMLRLQLDLDKPTAKRAWTAIVQAKVANQATCLRLLQHPSAATERLESYARRVRSGDVDNIEAQAAAYYFPTLLGRSFTRAQSSWANAALDYGYAVMRGACARALVAHGLLPSIGIFHASEQNAFNLADDLIEPYRPVVDLWVASTAKTRPNAHDTHDADAPLPPADKGALVSLLNVDMAMPRGTMAVLASIEHAAESLARVYDGSAAAMLELPQLIGLNQHRLDM